MKTVLVLIGKPGRLTPEMTRAAAAALGGGEPAPGRWLAPGEAWQLDMAGAAGADRVRRALDGAAIDVAVVAAHGRRKKLLIADMDSTIITVECIDELADVAGVKAEVGHITARAMRGELDFEAALDARLALLAGLPETALARVFEARVELNPGARTLVATMRAAGAHCALVSGGFGYFTRRVRDWVGFDQDVANELLFVDGRLTGVAKPILGRAAKLAMLRRLCAEHGLEAGAALAVGDGANDLEMIRAAGLGVAFHAKRVLAEAADVRIDHGDLTALLYLQGYHRDAFVPAGAAPVPGPAG